MKNSFADWLRKARVESGLSQQALALRVGVHRNTVSNWERRRCIPHKLSQLSVETALCAQPNENRRFLHGRKE